MKIKFQASLTTNLEPSIIIERVLALLKYTKYKVREVVDGQVIFSDNPWAFRLRPYAIGRLDGGIFKISVSNNGTSLTLNSYLNILPAAFTWVAGLTLPIILAKAYWASILFLLFYSITFIFQILRSKDLTREMIREILYDFEKVG